MVMLSVVITIITTLITQHTPKGDDRLSSMSNRPYYPFVHWGKPLSPTEPKQSGCIAAAGKHSDAILLSAALSSLEDAALKILISFNWQIPILATTMKRRSRRRSKASPGKQSSHWQRGEAPCLCVPVEELSSQDPRGRSGRSARESKGRFLFARAIDLCDHGSKPGMECIIYSM